MADQPPPAALELVPAPVLAVPTGIDPNVLLKIAFAQKQARKIMEKTKKRRALSEAVRAGGGGAEVVRAGRAVTADAAGTSGRPRGQKRLVLQQEATAQSPRQGPSTRVHDRARLAAAAGRSTPLSRASSASASEMARLLASPARPADEPAPAGGDPAPATGVATGQVQLTESVKYEPPAAARPDSNSGDGGGRGGDSDGEDEELAYSDEIADEADALLSSGLELAGRCAVATHCLSPLFTACSPPVHRGTAVAIAGPGPCRRGRR